MAQTIDPEAGTAEWVERKASHRLILSARYLRLAINPPESSGLGPEWYREMAFHISGQAATLFRLARQMRLED